MPDDPRDRDPSREAALERRIAQLEGELDAIHRSKMWRLWMASIALRHALGRALRAVTGLFARIFAGLRAPIRIGTEALAAAAVWLCLLAGSAVRLLAAGVRRNLRPSPSSALQQAAQGAPPATAEGRPRLLIVCPYPIFPPNHGGGVRLYNLVKLLARAVDLYLLIFITERDDGPQREALAPYCEGVFFHRWQPSFERPPWSLAPPNARIFASRRAAARIRDLVETYSIDVVQLEYTELAQYRTAVGPRAKVILVEHDVAFRSFRRRRSLGFAKRFPDSQAFGATFGDWMRLMRYEVAACRAVDQIHVMSRQDGSYLASFLPDGVRRMRVVPNAVDVAHYRPPEDHFERRRGVLFVGNFQNLPNVDALEFFLAEVWPRVRARRPRAALSLVGAKMSDDVLALDGRDGVRVVGEVPDMCPSYHGHRVLVAPIRAGSGTRLKLFEAFAAGIPVVSTTLGAEGIDYVAGRHLLIADDPLAFADAVLRLLDDRDLQRSLSQAALALVAERYDWSRSAEVNLEGCRELIARSPAAGTDALPCAPAGRPAVTAGPPVDVSIVIPTLDGGNLLERGLEAIAAQDFDRDFEVILVDSGSSAADLERMWRRRERAGGDGRAIPIRVHPIRKADFNHGLTRDLGASLACGRVLVFLNQDAVPSGHNWLRDLTAPLFASDPPAAVQGGICELPRGDRDARRFFWDSCGERFYFTRESQRWIGRYRGLGFSTVNAAVRRSVWQRLPFGWAPTMEDKKWQRAVVEAGLEIVVRHHAAVYHTHDYDLRSLRRRCRSEGMGWRLLGEPYRFADMARDMTQPHVYRELLRGIVRRQIKKPAELVFPWLRPWMLWVGNRWSRNERL